ncbi:hypothetical protein ACFOLG_01280 [Vogesella facilis]|uniref:Uncharacterized protein n=1 Tax=Vogesella facilis TaxID=1655232 RepID=A0ABV7RD37_9NEIS
MKSSTLSSTLKAVCMGLAMMLGTLTPAAAANVNQLDMEMDGNIIADSLNPAPNDWADMYTVTGGIGIPKTSPPTNFFAPTFSRDFDPNSNKDSTTFTTGSKDTLNIGGGGWQCVGSNNVNDKTDVLNAYAVAYKNPGDGHIIIYFAMEVASNEGTKDVGFWFLKDGTVGCTAGTKATNFSGNHQDGDLLIVSEYTKGGGVSTIKAFRWNGGANGSLDVNNPVVTGADCKNTTGTICATVNSKALKAGTDIPWLTKAKQSNPSEPGLTAADLDTGMFFEGGIDLTANNLSSCFSLFMADTRSSATPNSTLFDFTVGDFKLCGIRAEKTCGQATVDSDAVSFISPFTIKIYSTGAGAVNNVQFKETDALTGESCQIVSVNGDTSKAGPLTANTFVKVADTLDSSAPVTVAISCDGSKNSFNNSIAVTAGSAAGGSDLSTSATVGDTGANACKAAPNSVLDVVKDCAGMRLVVNGSNPLTLATDVKIKVSNSGNEAVDGLLVSDTKVKAADLKPVLCSDYKTAATAPTQLKPGDQACWAGSYVPTAADVPSGPSNAKFSDTATATATGVLSGVSRTASDDATCYLCDLDVDGVPDVLEIPTN